MCLCVSRGGHATRAPPWIYVHRALYCWRDAVAREEDESEYYVLPNHVMLQLALASPRTAEQLNLLRCPHIVGFRARDVRGDLCSRRLELTRRGVDASLERATCVLEFAATFLPMERSRSTIPRANGLACAGDPLR